MSRSHEIASDWMGRWQFSLDNFNTNVLLKIDKRDQLVTYAYDWANFWPQKRSESLVVGRARQRMKKPTLSKREWRTIVGLSVLALIPLVVLLVRLPRLWGPGATREKFRSEGCQSNLRQLARAMQLYLQDNDRHYPPTQIGGTRVVGQLTMSSSSNGPTQTLPVGWADAIIPYFRSVSLYMCPSERSGLYSVYPAKVGYTDYWMNTYLSGRTNSQLASPTSTLLLGEGNDGHDHSNATYSQMGLPPAWLKDQSSPAWRHLDGANYLMADGTIHWLRPDEVSHFGGRKNAFALK